MSTLSLDDALVQDRLEVVSSPAANSTDNPGSVRLVSGPETLSVVVSEPAAKAPDTVAMEHAERWLTRYSPKRAAAHRATLRQWFAHCAALGDDPLRVAEQQLAAYRVELEGRGFTPDGLNTKLTVLRGFYADLCEHEVIEADPAAEVLLTAPGARARVRAEAARARAEQRREIVAARLATPAPRPEIVAVGSPEVLANVERWLLTYSPHSARSHRPNIAAWLQYCHQHGIEPMAATALHVVAYQREVEAVPGVTWQLARARLGSVRAFYRWAQEEREVVVDPSTGTTRRQPVRLLASLAIPGRDRSIEQLALGYLLGFSGHTRRAYEGDLRAWLTFCQETDIDPLYAVRAHVDAYRTVLEEGRYKPATVRRRLIAVRQFFDYCVAEEALTRNPAATIRLPRLPNVSPAIGLSSEEIRALLVAAREDGPQAYALMTLLAMNGLRINEALGADVEHLKTAGGHRVLMVERKGYAGSRVPVPLNPRTVQALEAWLEVRPKAVDPREGDAAHGPIFVKLGGPRDGRGQRLTRTAAWGRTRTLAGRALPEKAKDIHPHVLRNAFVTLALDANIPMRDVADSAGHSSMDTTRRYDTGRGQLDRHVTYRLASLIGSTDA